MMKTMLIGLAMSTLLTTDVNLIPRNEINMNMDTETIKEIHTDILLKYYDEVEVGIEDDCMVFIPIDREGVSSKIYFWWK